MKNGNSFRKYEIPNPSIKFTECPVGLMEGLV